MPSPVLPAVLLLLLTGQVSAYSSGAPTSACQSMEPEHGGGSRMVTDAAVVGQYSITVAATGPTDRDYTVSVTATGGAVFRGVLLQARDVTDQTFLGTFTPKDSVDWAGLDCGGVGGAGSAVTNTDKNDKTLLEADWAATADYYGQVEFVATIIIGKMDWIPNVKSQTLTLSPPTTATPPPPTTAAADVENTTADVNATDAGLAAAIATTPASAGAPGAATLAPGDTAGPPTATGSDSGDALTTADTNSTSDVTTAAMWGPRAATVSLASSGTVTVVSMVTALWVMRP